MRPPVEERALYARVKRTLDTGLQPRLSRTLPPSATPKQRLSIALVKRRDHAAQRESLEPLGGPISLDELHAQASQKVQPIRASRHDAGARLM